MDLLVFLTELIMKKFMLTNNINIEKRYTNIIFPYFHKNCSLYEMELLNLMKKKLPKINHKKKKNFVGILNNKKIVNKKEYIKKIKIYLKKK